MSLLLGGAAIFLVVAALQLPGKSNFGVVLLASRHSHRDVFAGASLGLSSATVVSVLLGYVVERFLGGYLRWVTVVGGLVLIGFGIREILREPEIVGSEKVDRRELEPRQVVLLALSLTFLLEMGDNTQILAILFVASTANPLLVFVAVTLALIAVAGLSCVAARYLRRHVSEAKLRLGLGLLICAVGGLTVLLSLFPIPLPFSL